MTRMQWPMLPEDLQFDAFFDEDQILDFINELEKDVRKVFLTSLDNSENEDVTIYSRVLVPIIHIVLMKFSNKDDGGLILLLSRDEKHIYSYFERLKEENPEDKDDINDVLNRLHAQIKATDELLKSKK